ncbi:hypothetical protein LCGC14_0749890 [marine sediment metagenome]|uniref:Uncharacterized protein n=1 Tax=marine sediment metagenome TaxID=412755 RepID=A0A0F9TBC7_9ZZZZ
MDKGRFVYEVVPDTFGDKLSVDEIGYWISFGIIQSAVRHDVDYMKCSFKETKEEIEKARNKKKGDTAKWQKKK